MAGPRILVVEDDENIAFVITAALELAGLEAVDVHTGRDALSACSARQAPDLVVLDVMLPDLDGFEVCRRLRAERVSIPVLFLTARDAIEDRVHGLTLGGDDYLVKPFSVQELTARVRALLRRAGHEPTDSRLCVGELELDDDAHVVTRRGEPVALSPTEYRLLHYLLRNAGRAVSKDQILEHVWAYEFDAGSTVVETFISSLRRKIGPGLSPVIHTVRGVGYRLDTR